MVAPKAMQSYPQYILTNVNKEPVHPVSGYHIDATNPENWMPYENALALSQLKGLGVAFSFSDSDPFFCLDVDTDKLTKVWSDSTKTIMSQFQGCAMEVSQSGWGLHIFGTGIPPGSTRANKNLKLDFFTRSHYVVLTGIESQGDAAFSPTNVVGLINAYFPPKDEKEPVPDWTTEPTPEWNGPTDNNELFKKMFSDKGDIRDKSKATPIELHTADDRLCEIFPPKGGKHTFDRSEADFAYFGHLAFWTGKNCERMYDIYRISQLYEVSDKRDSYIRLSILNAIKGCTNVYGGKKPTTASEAGAPGVNTYVTIGMQMELFKDVWYSKQMCKVVDVDGEFLTEKGFKFNYGGRTYQLNDEYSKKENTTDAWKALMYLFHRQMPDHKVNGFTFRPDTNDIIIRKEGLSLYNTYKKIETKRVKGDVTPFLTQISEMLPNREDQKILITYLASLIRHPGEKFQWCVVLQGAQGNGKSFIARVLTYCVGERYSHKVNASDIGNKFNGWLEGKLFVVIDEIEHVGKRKIDSVLKVLISDPEIEVQGKGKDQVTKRNFANFLMNTNSKTAIPKEEGDRRYCVFFTAQQDKSDVDDARMGRLYDWCNHNDGYAKINEYLRTCEIWDKYNPTKTESRTPPKPSCYAEVLKWSEPPLKQYIKEFIASSNNREFVSSVQINDCLKKDGYTITPTKMVKILTELGYVRLCRSKKFILGEGGAKPVIYCRKDSPNATLTDDNVITELYLKEQGVI